MKRGAEAELAPRELPAQTTPPNGGRRRRAPVATQGGAAHTPRKPTTLGWRKAAIMLASLRGWGGWGGRGRQARSGARAGHPDGWGACTHAHTHVGFKGEQQHGGQMQQHSARSSRLPSTCMPSMPTQPYHAAPLQHQPKRSLLQALQHGVGQRERALRVVGVLNVHLRWLQV